MSANYLNGRLPDVVVQVQDTGADTDALSGTLAGVDRPAGTWTIQVASTVNTATIAVTCAGTEGTGQTAQPIQLFTNGVPLADQGIIYKFKTTGTARPVVALGGTTGTIHTIARYWAGI